MDPVLFGKKDHIRRTNKFQICRVLPMPQSKAVVLNAAKVAQNTVKIDVNIAQGAAIAASIVAVIGTAVL